MKSVFTFLFIILCGYNYAQEKYPTVVNFEVTKKTTIDNVEKEWLKETYYFLMLTSQKAIDLKNYGNEKCEFSIIVNNKNRILLEFNQPSKLISKGRCASGEEKGYIYFELDDNANLIKAETFLVESCLWSIELIDTNRKDTNKIKYVSENYQTTKTFSTTIDLQNVIVIKEEKQD